MRKGRACRSRRRKPIPHTPAKKRTLGESELTALTKMNIRLQLAHLITHAKVFGRTREGSLKLHGWFYRIETGDVQAWDHETDVCLPLEQAPFVSEKAALFAGHTMQG